MPWLGTDAFSGASEDGKPRSSIDPRLIGKGRTPYVLLTDEGRDSACMPSDACSLDMRMAAKSQAVTLRDELDI